MWFSVSDTAEHGGYMGGEALITDEVRQRMLKLLSDIKDGSYAASWIEENRNGLPNFTNRRAAERQHPIEEVGVELRSMMPFLDAKKLS
jgi:ketol-acid reductoisomerase